MRGRCLLCEMEATDKHHFPVARQRGGRQKHRKVFSDYLVESDLPTVPLCHSCHMAIHAAQPGLVERLAMEAPGHWQDRGEWDKARPLLERWQARRDYLRSVDQRGQ